MGHPERPARAVHARHPRAVHLPATEVWRRLLSSPELLAFELGRVVTRLGGIVAKEGRIVGLPQA